MRRALLSIDYTNDFVADNGALTCGKPAQDIESEIVRVTKEAIENGDFVVFAIDAHKAGDLYHPETKLYPPHNIMGTDGRKLYGTLHNVYEQYKERENVYWMDKTRYSALAGTDLLLQLRARGIEEVHITGVTTDICCLHTCVDLYNEHYPLVIHEKAVASFNPDGHVWALGHFKNCLGAKIV
ncbi:cysteine hydrolase family protein [Priestia koreensis]|uniref:Isochorismatase n=1 Tax=Priestia koreensis TaxID=284581 RepID=A0A0M0KF51_9BACI|nr:isochorismatase family cysteine hydrolase [Priestia koreensis]KOO37222.1 isochorismatase [Priestia koreensis]